MEQSPLHNSMEDHNVSPEIQEFLATMRNDWKSALAEAASQLRIENTVSPDQEISVFDLETATADRLISASTHESVILGVNGPGAVGKGTIISELLNRYPNAHRLINTTTRPKRETEVDGKDYYFVTEEEFQQLQASGKLATTLHRPGRGWYGFQKDHVAELSSQRGVIIVEEAPKTLEVLFTNTPELGHVLTYLLPPNPVFDTLYGRLNNRMKSSGESATLEALHSTLGPRQLDEFRSAFVPTTAFIVNDKIDRALSQITTPLMRHLE